MTGLPAVPPCPGGHQPTQWLGQTFLWSSDPRAIGGSFTQDKTGQPRPLRTGDDEVGVVAMTSLDPSQADSASSILVTRSNPDPGQDMNRPQGRAALRAAERQPYCS
jgi:hypothetical protein